MVRILGGIFFFYGFSMYIHLANIMRGLLVRKACWILLFTYVSTYMYVFVLLDIGRDIGSICTRMLLIPNIVIQLCINYSNIYILLVRISYVIWPSNPGIFRKIDYIFIYILFTITSILFFSSSLNNDLDFLSWLSIDCFLTYLFFP